MGLGYYDDRIVPLVAAAERVGALHALDKDVNWVANGDRGIKHIALGHQTSQCTTYGPRKSARTFVAPIRQVLSEGQGCPECIGRVLEHRASSGSRGQEATVTMLVEGSILRDRVHAWESITDTLTGIDMARQFAGRLDAVLGQAESGRLELDNRCTSILVDLRDEFLTFAQERTDALRSQGAQLHAQAVSDLMEAESGVPDWLASPAERSVLGWRTAWMRDHPAAQAYTAWWSAVTGENRPAAQVREATVDALMRYGLRDLFQLETLPVSSLAGTPDETPHAPGQLLASLQDAWLVQARQVASAMVSRWEQRFEALRSKTALVPVAVCTTGAVSSSMALVSASLAVGTTVSVHAGEALKAVVLVSGAVLERLSELSAVPGSHWAAVFVAPVPQAAPASVLETALTLWDPFTENGEFVEFASAFASASALLESGRKVTVSRPGALEPTGRQR